MKISYDENKRQKVLEDRGLDLANAGQVFEGFYLSRADPKHSDVEPRTIKVGMLGNEIVVLLVWTPRNGERRIITMWKANEKERERYFAERERLRRG